MAGKERMRLTDAAITRLRPREREYAVWDTHVAGLGVRVRPSGSMSFVLLHRSDARTRRRSLGPVASKGIDDVRRECHAFFANPESENTDGTVPSASLFRDFVAGPWKETCYSRYKPSTRKGVKNTLRTQLLPAFGPTPLNRITRNQVLRWFDGYSQTAPGGANRAISLLRQILNFAIACGHLVTNPTRGIKSNRRTQLTRFLSSDEVRRLNRTLDEHLQHGPSPRQQAEIIRLLLLTGCRKNEILSLRWSEVRGDTLLLADTKTGPRMVPLNAQARRVIERQPRGLSPFVFPSPRDINRPQNRHLPLWYAVRREADLEDVRLHDLRHTLASHAVLSGVPVPLVSRLLGHSNVRMTLRYAHLADKHVSDAAERIGAGLARLLALE